MIALQVSARTGEGVDGLIHKMAELMPEAPPYFPPDEVTDRSLRFLVAELVREAAFVELSQEIPYSTAVEIEDFDESGSDLVRIRANLVVERRSQKGMVIGQGGSMIKRIGVRARVSHARTGSLSPETPTVHRPQQPSASRPSSQHKRGT